MHPNGNIPQTTLIISALNILIAKFTRIESKSKDPICGRNNVSLSVYLNKPFIDIEFFGLSL